MTPFAPGTRSERDEKDGDLLSPRCTSLHRRTEGHGVYFCRVAAAVTGQKACGFHPASLPRVSPFFSLSASRSVAPFPFLSLQPLFPCISLCVSSLRPSLALSPAAFLSSLSPHGHPSHSFFSPRYASFYATARPPVGPCLAPRFSLCSIRAIPSSRSLPSSAVLPPLLLLPNSTTSVAFSPVSPVLSPAPSMCKPIAHASERASGNIATAWRTKRTRRKDRKRKRERKKKDDIRVPYT